MKSKFLFWILTTFFLTGSAKAYDPLVGDGLCHQIETYVNALVDFATTQCIAAADDRDRNQISFIIFPNRPLFHVEKAKKPWLVTVVSAVGKVLRDNPKVRSGRLVLSDPTLLKHDTGYSIETGLAKELQSKMYAGEWTLENGYDRLVKSMKPFKVTRK